MKDIIDAINLEQNLQDIIIEKGLLTGSRGFGLKVSDSTDYDYVVNIDLYDYVLTLLRDNRIEYHDSNYFKGIRVSLKGKMINLFVVNHKDIPIWRLTTSILRDLYVNHKVIELTSKHYRVRLFEVLLSQLKEIDGSKII